MTAALDDVLPVSRRAPLSATVSWKAVIGSAPPNSMRITIAAIAAISRVAARSMTSGANHAAR